MATGVQSWKIAKGLYVMPLLFAYSQLIDGDTPERVQVFAFGLLGLYAFTSVFTGYLFKHLNVIERVAMLGLAALLLWPSLILNVVGLVCFIAAFGYQRLRGSDQPVIDFTDSAELVGSDQPQVTA